MSHLAGHALPLNVHSSTYCAAAMHMGHMGKDRVLHFGVGELHLVNSAATSDRISLSIEKPRTLATARGSISSVGVLWCSLDVSLKLIENCWCGCILVFSLNPCGS